MDFARLTSAVINHKLIVWSACDLTGRERSHKNLHGIGLEIDCKRFPVRRSPNCPEELCLPEMLRNRASANPLLVFFPIPKAVFRLFYAFKLIKSALWHAAFHLVGEALFDGVIILVNL